MSEIPQHPAGPVGEEVLEQQDKGYVCSINAVHCHNNDIALSGIVFIKDLQRFKTKCLDPNETEIKSEQRMRLISVS